MSSVCLTCSPLNGNHNIYFLNKRSVSYQLSDMVSVANLKFTSSVLYRSLTL